MCSINIFSDSPLVFNKMIKSADYGRFYLFEYHKQSSDTWRQIMTALNTGKIAKHEMI